MNSKHVPGKQIGVPTLATFIFIVMALFILPSCSDEEVKPNRDSIITTNTLATVGNIFKDYRTRRFDLMESHYSEAFKNFRPDTGFRSVEHEYRVQRVRIEDDTVRIVLGWEGTWKLESEEVSSGGQCTMIFSSGTGKLTGIEGDNPFAIPGRRLSE